MTDEAGVSGWIDDRFEPVRSTIENKLSSDAGWAGAVAAYLNGKQIIDLWVTPSYGPDTLQLMYSSTKGIASLCVAYLIDRGHLDPDRAVAHYWADFGKSGKQQILIRELLSHQAGLLAVRDGFSLEEYIEHSELARRIAREDPAWTPGTRHGYHALTWGTLIEELTRRITGQTLGEFFDNEIRTPYDLELFLGLPESEEPNLVISANGDAFGRDSWTGLERVALNLENPQFPVLPEMERLRAVRASALPAISAVGTARGLAKAYAAAITGLDNKPPLLTEHTVKRASSPQSTGQDAVLGFETSFALGFQTPTQHLPLSGAGSFGHDGFAGSLGFSSPRHGLAFGYLTSWIPAGGGADPFAQELINVLLESS